ncbi:hypothetical protein ACRAWD_16815 [Caulobacter segnis]
MAGVKPNRPMSEQLPRAASLEKCLMIPSNSEMPPRREWASWGRRSVAALVSEGFMKLSVEEKAVAHPFFSS